MRIHDFKSGKLKALFVPVLLLLASFRPAHADPMDGNALLGAWQYGPEHNRTVMIVTERVFAVATYDLPGRKFISSYGGTWQADNGKIVQTIEWNSLNPDQVGKEVSLGFQLSGDRLMIKDKSETWNRQNKGVNNEITGAWVITGNYRDGKPSKRSSPFYPRRTMKVLGGGRFQWIAYNAETHEFQNAGGGSYSATNGTYTETIEFFTKTAESVGKKLSFEYSFIDGDWRHKGEKSTGGPMDEIWSKRETLEKKH